MRSDLTFGAGSMIVASPRLLLAGLISRLGEVRAMLTAKRLQGAGCILADNLCS